MEIYGKLGNKKSKRLWQRYVPIARRKNVLFSSIQGSRISIESFGRFLLSVLFPDILGKYTLFKNCFVLQRKKKEKKIFH